MGVEGPSNGSKESTGDPRGGGTDNERAVELVRRELTRHQKSVASCQQRIAYYQQSLTWYQQNVTRCQQDLARYQQAVSPQLPRPQLSKSSIARAQSESSKSLQQQQKQQQQSTGGLAPGFLQSAASPARGSYGYNPILKAAAVTNTYLAADGQEQKEKIEVAFRDDSVQCPWCQRLFANAEQRRDHKLAWPYGCPFHLVCFGAADVVLHAEEYAHDRCFVAGCKTKQFVEKRCDDEVIEKHVKKDHGLLGRKA